MSGATITIAYTTFFSSKTSRMVEHSRHPTGSRIEAALSIQKASARVGAVTSHHVAQRNLLAYDLRVERNLRHQAEPPTTKVSDPWPCERDDSRGQSSNQERPSQSGGKLLYLEAHASSAKPHRASSPAGQPRTPAAAGSKFTSYCAPTRTRHRPWTYHNCSTQCATRLRSPSVVRMPCRLQASSDSIAVEGHCAGAGGQRSGDQRIQARVSE